MFSGTVGVAFQVICECWGQRKIQSLGEVVGSGEIPESWGRVGWEESGKLSHLYQASAAERPEVRAEQESDTGEEEDEGKLV